MRAAIPAGAGSDEYEALIDEGSVAARKSFARHLGISLRIFKVISAVRASEEKSYFAPVFVRPRHCRAIASNSTISIYAAGRWRFRNFHATQAQFFISRVCVADCAAGPQGRKKWKY